MNVRQIGRYRINEELGRGGFAVVYRAYDPRFKRDVALKVLSHGSASDPNFRERFEREAQTIAALEHRAIVPVYDYGEHEGQPYLAMRLMTGGTLADRLVRGPLPVAEISSILERLCAALDMAHGRNFIHRDLKPANILFDDEGKAYLGDFGIAKLTLNPQTTALVGTPRYMAPEQLESKDLDARTDVYQMGVVLYEMLTGYPPYDADTTHAVMYKILNEPIPSVQSVKEDLPLSYDGVIQRAMAKDKSERLASTKELAAVFQAATQGQGLPARTQPAGEFSPSGQETPAARRPIPLWGWAVGSLLALGLAILALNPGWLSGDVATPISTIPPARQESLVVAVTIIFPTAPPTEEPTATPTSTATPTPTNTPTPTETPTPTDTPTPLPTAVMTTWELGHSVSGRPLSMREIGYGPHHIVLVGAIHGNEPKTQTLVERLADHFETHRDLVAPHVTLHFLPALNPDGVVARTRNNATGVDLNRNWHTPTWVKDTPQIDGIYADTGGLFPFSEPETAALSNWLTSLRANADSIHVIFYHDHASAPVLGSVQPGYTTYGTPASPSLELALALALAADYVYAPTWHGPYQPGGEAIHWCALQGMAAADVSLSPGVEIDGRPEDRIRTLFEATLDSILALIGP